MERRLHEVLEELLSYLAAVKGLSKGTTRMLALDEAEVIAGRHRSVSGRY